MVVVKDEEFEPHLGGTRNKDGKATQKYAGRVLVAARLAGAATGVRARRFDGSRIGRGASIGRLLSSRDRLAGFRSRRAIVKTRLVRLGAKGVGTARAHLRYIQRDGVTREGAPGELYSASHDQADGKAFLERSASDRHQFRFIVSAEDGAEYPDLKPYIRRLMTQVETDLGTKLDWVAVDHYNTERPHSHIMLRGVDGGEGVGFEGIELGEHGRAERIERLKIKQPGRRASRLRCKWLKYLRSYAFGAAAAFCSSAALACWTRASMAAASLMARSERTLRSRVMPAALRPSINRE